MPSPVKARFDAPPEGGSGEQQPATPPAARYETATTGSAELESPDHEVSIDGQPLSAALDSALTCIEVQQSLSVVDMAVLTFDNPGGKICDAPVLACGREVEVKLGYVGQLVSLFKGDIVAVEPVFPIEGNPFVLVRAYDRKHRLRRGRKQRTFLNQKISEIATDIASEASLTPDIEDTEVQHPYIVQNNQTNIDFLHELARRYHVEVRVLSTERKLVLRKPRTTAGPEKTLKWGKDLKSFYVRKSVANVPTEVEARTWDVTQKSMTSSKADGVHGALGDSIVEAAREAFGEAKRLIAVRPTEEPREAAAMAASILNEEAMNACKGHGTCVGDASIVPGMVIELEALGALWSGKYYVTGATHVLHHFSGYATRFEVKRNA
ncbi:MAG: contractile injection system protein, VgrG/Pvc8 family [Planctomycetes bacterium]|nr:contractile injection system protein, VgrG/Pvc8 family [Planctomycetota bacterium]